MRNSPKILTILPTYRCTAACEQCCFESSPNLTQRLSKDEILSFLENSTQSFNDLEMIVFTGGECFTIGETLYESISIASSKVKNVRCVTNGYWGKKKANAFNIAKRLHESGLTEINFSTGIDHQAYVEESSILNAAESCLSFGIKTLITVEKDTEHSDCFYRLKNSSLFKKHSHDRDLFKIMGNTWMPFNQNFEYRGYQLDNEELRVGCSQVFDNLVLTPHKRISSCCGLTFEHIPEMKIGHLDKDNLKQVYMDQQKDFLKLWISIDGPLVIMEKLIGEKRVKEKFGELSHSCQACVYLHKDSEIKSNLMSDCKKFIPDILMRRTIADKLSQQKENKNAI